MHVYICAYVYKYTHLHPHDLHMYVYDRKGLILQEPCSIRPVSLSHTHTNTHTHISVCTPPHMHGLTQTPVHTHAWINSHTNPLAHHVTRVHLQYGHTALDMAVARKQEECAAVLREQGGPHSLLRASESGMCEVVAARIAAGDDVNARNQVGCTWLPRACVCVCMRRRACVCVTRGTQHHHVVARMAMGHQWDTNGTPMGHQPLLTQPPESRHTNSLQLKHTNAINPTCKGYSHHN